MSGIAAHLQDPVCGGCGNKHSAHHREQYGSEWRLYCNTYTNGDLFTAEPSPSVILDMLEERRPEIYAELVSSWKRENGHPTEAGGS